MTEYKIIVNEEQVELSALHIESSTYKRIDITSLNTLINEWFTKIGFVSKVENLVKYNDVEIKLNDNEVIKFINNGCETIIVAYNIQQSYVLRDYKRRKRCNIYNNKTNS